MREREFLKCLGLTADMYWFKTMTILSNKCNVFSCKVMQSGMKRELHFPWALAHQSSLVICSLIDWWTPGLTIENRMMRFVKVQMLQAGLSYLIWGSILRKKVTHRQNPPKYIDILHICIIEDGQQKQQQLNMQIMHAIDKVTNPYLSSPYKTYPFLSLSFVT